MINGAAGSIQDRPDVFAALFGLCGDSLGDGTVRRIHRDLPGGDDQTEHLKGLRIGADGAGCIYCIDD